MQAFAVVSELVLFAAVVFIAFVVLAGYVYDLKQFPYKSQLATCMRKFHFATAPAVTILIYTDENITLSDSCLLSIKKLRYRLYDVVIINGGTRSKKLTLPPKYKPDNYRLYNPRGIYSKQELCRRAYALSKKSGYILMINGNDELLSDALRRCTSQLLLQPKANVVIPAVVARTPQTMGELISEYIILKTNSFNKAKSLFGLTESRDMPDRYFCRNNVVIDSPATSYRKYYDFQWFIATTYSGFSSYQLSTQSQQIALRLASLFLLLLIAYIMSIAALGYNGSLLILCIALFVVWAIAATWSDPVMSAGEKLFMVFSAPMMFFVSYVYYIFKILNVTKLMK